MPNSKLRNDCKVRSTYYVCVCGERGRGGKAKINTSTYMQYTYSSPRTAGHDLQARRRQGRRERGGEKALSLEEPHFCFFSLSFLQKLCAVCNFLYYRCNFCVSL